jgi:hypothetical protein
MGIRIWFWIQGYEGKSLQLKKKIDRKLLIKLFLGLYKGRASYRRSLQPAKENILHFKT